MDKIIKIKNFHMQGNNQRNSAEKIVDKFSVFMTAKNFLFLNDSLGEKSKSG